MKADWRELSSFFEMDSDAVLSVEEGRVSFANRAAKELLGDCEGEKLAQLLPGCPEEPDGESFSAVLTAKGQALVVSGVRQKRMTLLRLRPEERKTALIADATLNALRSAAIQIQFPAERLLARLTEEENDLYGSALRHGAYELRRLVQNLSDLNGLLDGTLVLQREIFDLGSLCAALAGSVRTFMPPERAALKAECESGCMVAADWRRMEQIVLNLLANAYRHTPSEGAIELKVTKNGGTVSLTVSDNGEGLTPGEMNTLFTLPRNELSASDGAGLGLRLVRELAEQFDGRLTARSGKEGGCSFTLELPLSRVLYLRDAPVYDAGSSTILTELSPVLDHRAYRSRFTD